MRHVDWEAVCVAAVIITGIICYTIVQLHH